MARDALDGVAIVVEVETLGSECHTLINLHIVADDGRCADNHARAMVDGKIVANLSPGMYVDAGFGVCHLANHTRNHGHSKAEQRVGNAVVADGLDGRITSSQLTAAGSPRYMARTSP